jgi:SAM-dependent methyltransferase
MSARRQPDSRAAELDGIRRTYAGYEASGRERLWDRSNPGIARCSTEARAAVVALLARSVPHDAGRVLDLGCGDGSLAHDARAAGIGSTWNGVDLRPEAVAQAAADHPWGRFEVAAADALPFEPDTFDAVAATVLFSSLPSRTMEADVAAEIGRVLKPGGWLVWYDLRYDNPANPAVHGVSRARLRELFPGWQAELRTLTLLPPLARRLGRLTPVAYPVLHALPVLRSHLVGRLRRPG